MKYKIFLINYFLVLSYISFSQTGVFQFNSTVNMEFVDANGNSKVPTQITTSLIGQRFTIVRTVSSDYIIRMLDYDEGNPNYRKFNNKMLIGDPQLAGLTASQQTTDLINNEVYFKISAHDFNYGTSKMYKRFAGFSVNALTMPFKIRPQKDNFDFTGSLNLSGAGNLKFRISRVDENYFNFVFGFGISNEKMTDQNSKASSTEDTAPPPANLSALTLSSGFVFEFGKAQIGIVGGWDMLSDKDQHRYGWVYNGKPWIGLSIGTSIIKPEGNQDSKLKRNKGYK